MRHTRMTALGASGVALLLAAACTTGGGATATGGAMATGTAPSGATLASTFVLGAPPECPERPFCAVGLKETYGIEFKEIKALDAGGPITVAAVESGEVQVGLLFTSDPNIAAKDFVLLEDDKQLQLADNLIPVIRQEKLDEYPRIDFINDWMAKLTQEELTALNEAVSIDQEDPADVVSAWLQENGLEESGIVNGLSITVGSTNFYEQEILGEMFAQLLEANGAEVERRFQLGPREVVFPALESGEIDMLAEYAATALEFVNEAAGEATTDPAETSAKLNERLQERGLAALGFAPATDQNGFVVTRATADQYSLSKLSDLTKPAP